MDVATKILHDESVGSCHAMACCSSVFLRANVKVCDSVLMCTRLLCNFLLRQKSLIAKLVGTESGGVLYS
jgi:hypothetical protein